jgi:hypothetical protein
MNNKFNTKPHFQTIVDKQAIALHRLNHDAGKRTEADMSNFRRSLEPCPLSDVELPKLPLVRYKNDTLKTQYVVLGEVAQIPGKLILMHMRDFGIVTHFADDLELIPPNELIG